jgi:hypothetical protein
MILHHFFCLFFVFLEDRYIWVLVVRTKAASAEIDRFFFLGTAKLAYGVCSSWLGSRPDHWAHHTVLLFWHVEGDVHTVGVVDGGYSTFNDALLLHFI